MASFTPPAGYTRIKVVHSFLELVSTPFTGGVNALCWPRTLPGNFEEILEHLDQSAGVATLDDARLRALPVSAAGSAAVETLLNDQRLLRAQGHAPVLDCIHNYARDEATAAVPTDVYSFHTDSAPVATDTYLCTYCGPASEGLRNDEAQRLVDIPQIRAKLLKLFGGEDSESFHEYLRENCYDLHYAALPDARPFSFGVGNLWRLAVQYPKNPVPAFIHRAPATHPGRHPRLLLIS